METESLVNFDFDSDKIVNKLIMKVLLLQILEMCHFYRSYKCVKPQSECLKDALGEIDTSNEVIEIVISKEKEFMRLSSFGLIGDTHASISYI